ncbi:helix-turn-helix domain-containing protein [Mycobacterium sp. SMC-16]|uniref:helix-turn-helix domain-containing protein n=1 Tax=Mycobacterium sp. SMC-16 TaxID=3385967 RepID=UPI00390C403D
MTERQVSNDDELLKPAQLAERWRVSLRTVHRYLADGRVKSIRTPGGRYRIRPEDAAAAIEASE